MTMVNSGLKELMLSLCRRRWANIETALGNAACLLGYIWVISMHGVSAVLISTDGPSDISACANSTDSAMQSRKASPVHCQLMLFSFV